VSVTTQKVILKSVLTTATASAQQTITLGREMYSCLKINLKATDVPMKLSLQN